MDVDRKDINLLVGRRLKEARINLGCRQSDFADTLQVSEEHYRKFEAGATGLSTDKLFLLYRKYDIDPTYLITGECMKEFDVDYYVANCTKDQRDHFLDRVLAYIQKLIKI